MRSKNIASRRSAVLSLTSASIAALFPRFSQAAEARGSQEIRIGQSAVLSGVVGNQVKAINAGAMLALGAVNASGGIGGRRFKLISLDDEFDPKKTVANTETLIREHRVDALFGYIGSANVVAADTVVRRSGIPLVGAAGVSDSARSATKGVAYYVRAGYGHEATRIVEHLALLGVRRIALAHLANPGGEEIKVDLTAKLASNHLELVAATALRVDGSDIDDAAKLLAASHPQAIIVVASGLLPAKLIQALENLQVFPSYYGMSNVPLELTASTMGGKLRGLVVSQVMPYPWVNANGPMEEYRRLAGAASVPVTYATLEGYVSACVLIEAFRRAGKGASAGLHESLKSLRGRIAGLDIDFTGASNTGSAYVDLVHVNGAGHITR